MMPGFIDVHNLLEIKPQEIAKVTVLRTIVGGRQVYPAP